MERGLLWLPLLGLFFWLAWAGWNEYQKVEGYRVWAERFDKSKYDIRAALGQKADRLTWGKPTRKGLVDLQEVSLSTIAEVRLTIDGRVVDWQTPPETGKSIAVELVPADNTGASVLQIPFTEVAIAAQWAGYLSQLLTQKPSR